MFACVVVVQSGCLLGTATVLRAAAVQQTCLSAVDHVSAQRATNSSRVLHHCLSDCATRWLHHCLSDCTTVCLTAPHAGCTTTLAPLFRSGRLSQSLDSMEAQFTTFDRLYSSVESGLQSIHQFHELILENLFSFKSVVFYANMLAVA